MPERKKRGAAATPSPALPTRSSPRAPPSASLSTTQLSALTAKAKAKAEPPPPTRSSPRAKAPPPPATPTPTAKPTAPAAELPVVDGKGEEAVADEIAEKATPHEAHAASLPATATVTAETGPASGGDTAALRSLAEQQDAYRRKLEQLQQQHAHRQQQWQRQQADDATRHERMQHIQQKLHERIRQKRQRDSDSDSATTASSEPEQGLEEKVEAVAHQSESGLKLSLPDSAPGTLSASTAKAYEDFQRARQEQLLRLQQYQSEQQKQAVTMSAADAPLASPTVAPTTVMATLSVEEQMLVQQHDIVRQQHVLQSLLQQQQQQQRGTKTLATAGDSTPSAAKKRKKSLPESQMEALVRDLFRLSAASNAVDLRTCLDKMTAWLHRCFDVGLLRFAQRDFRDIVATKRPGLVASGQWATDIQVKVEYITQKIAQVILAMTTHASAVQAATATATATAVVSAPVATSESEVVRLAVLEQAYAAMKAQIRQQQQSLSLPVLYGGAVASPGRSAPLSSPLATAASPQPRPVVTNAVPARPSVPVLAPQSTPVSSTLSARTSSPLKVALTSAHPTATAGPGPAAPLSPRVVQQLYDVDLTSRSCAGVQDDSEDKFYIPVKVIAKMMRQGVPIDTTHPTASTTASTSASVSSLPVSAVGVAPAAGARTTSADGGDRANSEPLEPAGATANEQPKGVDEKTTGTQSASTVALSLQKRRVLAQRGKQPAQQQSPIRIDDDAAAFMQECVTEFILYLTSEAKDQCAFESARKPLPLLGSHVVQGMENLGFATYAKVLACYNAKIKKLQDAQVQKRVEKKLQDKRLREQTKQRATVQTPATAPRVITPQLSPAVTAAEAAAQRVAALRAAAMPDVSLGRVQQSTARAVVASAVLPAQRIPTAAPVAVALGGIQQPTSSSVATNAMASVAQAKPPSASLTAAVVPAVSVNIANVVAPVTTVAAATGSAAVKVTTATTAAPLAITTAPTAAATTATIAATALAITAMPATTTPPLATTTTATASTTPTTAPTATITTTTNPTTTTAETSAPATSVSSEPTHDKAQEDPSAPATA